MGSAAPSDELLAGASWADGVIGAAVVEDVVIEAAVVETVEVAPVDWLSDAATVVVNVRAVSADDPDPDVQPETQKAAAASNAVTPRIVSARQLVDNDKLLDRTVNYLPSRLGLAWSVLRYSSVRTCRGTAGLSKDAVSPAAIS